MKYIKFLLVVVAIFVIIFIFGKTIEPQQGALIQLMAKGPQDTYLTADASKYIPPWYWGYGRYGGWGSWWPWNISTRTRKSWWW